MPPKTKRRRAAASPTGIAGQLREIIDRRGLTAYGLAQSAGVAPSVVSRFLSRERGLTLETFNAIAEALGLRLVETARGRGRPSKPTRPGRPRVADAVGEDPAEVPQSIPDRSGPPVASDGQS